MTAPLHARIVRAALLACCAQALVTACTDLSLDGDEQLSCSTNADCPDGLSCAAALQLCVDEKIVAQEPIAAIGDAQVDAPRISRVAGFARTVVTATFNKKPADAATGEVDGRLAVSCEADDGGDETWRCAFDARDFPDESDGGYDFVVTAQDAAGNTARARARFEIDTAPPSVAPDSVSISYETSDDAIVREASALGALTSATLRLILVEPSAEDPVATLVPAGGEVVPLVRDAARSDGAVHVFVLGGGDLGLTPDGAHPLRLAVIDDVGNADDVDIGATLDVDRSAPPPAVVDVPDSIVYARVPWGSGADPSARFAVTAAAGAAESGTTAIITSGDTLTSTLMATAPVDGAGAFAATLQVIDVPRVYVWLVDGAGNIGPPARVRDIEWTASLGGRRRSDDFSNPHALFAPSAFDTDVLRPNLVNEPLSAGDLLAGTQLTVDALPHLRDIRTDATGQPKRMSHAMGYLPTIGAPVLFGGVPDRNRAQTASTFVLRNDHWVPILDNPPTNGALAYDTARRTLLALLVNGDAWSFDGDAWSQRPTAPIPTMLRGPIAWDPIADRLVTVQGTETWVLGLDDTWTRLASDAPLAGLAIFDGLNTPLPGAVIGFDAIDEHVILYGREASGGGGVYALVDDLWTRLGDAPPTDAATAVEDLETGRVHFVCRTVGGGTDPAMLTWDGAAMQVGPANPDPNSGCAATYDRARHRVLVHGGTGDNVPNVQALPQTTIATLRAGDAAWVIDSTGAAPPALTHNGAGTSHFNPVLDRVMLYGAEASLFVRTTSFFDGEDTVPLAGTTGPFGLPWFDGVRSRYIDGTSERFFDGAAWVNRVAPFSVGSDAVFTYDVAADRGFGYTGEFDGTTETVRIRNDTRTVLTTSTAPPARRGAAMAYDVANARVVLVGGRAFGAGAALFGDTWVFEDEDWHQIEDSPFDVDRAVTFSDVGRHQLVYDAGRGVVIGMFDGALFELRGDTWVERAVDVPPRANALFVYDAFNGELRFVGGLEFEIIATAHTRVNIGATTAAHVARFDLASTGASADAAVIDLRVDGAAGATGADAAGSVDGVSVLMWGRSSFEAIAENDAGAAAPAAFSVTRTGAELGRVLDRPLVVALASAPTGPGAAPARVVTSALEVRVRYREP